MTVKTSDDKKSLIGPNRPVEAMMEVPNLHHV